MEVRLIPAYDRPQDVLALFTEYTESIIAQGDEEVADCLRSQHYDEEIRNLRKKYGLPKGRLYLAEVDGRVVGCVALRALEKDACELKRLFVRPAYRSAGVGRALVDRILADAWEIGYRYVRLDTFPFMESALGMYERYGFRAIPCYNDNPAPSAIFLQLDLA